MDGGANDLDDEADGDATIPLLGERSSDLDQGGLGLNETGCSPATSLTPFLAYDWFEGDPAGTLLATGENPQAFGEPLGFQEITLRVEDTCRTADVDHVQAFVGTGKTELARRSFADSLSTDWTTTGIAHRTDACNVDADGAYLAFTLGPDGTGACTYRADDPVQGTATLSADPRNADVLALEFSTRFDTREGIGSLDEELFGNVREDVLAVEASFDGGQTWTQPNHTFSYDRMDEDLDRYWKRAGGIYNLSDHEVTGDVLFRFTFDSVTASEGGGYGWLVDDVRITSLTT